MNKCSICEREVETPHETPDDPPFFPSGGGRHCDSCEHWLLTGILEDE